MISDRSWRRMRFLVRAERYLNWLLLLSVPWVAWKLATAALAGDYVRSLITLSLVVVTYLVWRHDPPLIKIIDEDDV